jgi:hypothetical protein
MTHPFIKAVQKAYDEHGLPPGICYIGVGKFWTRDENRFWVWPCPAGVDMATKSASGKTMEKAYQAAIEMFPQILEDSEQKARAIEALQAAGLPISMLK